MKLKLQTFSVVRFAKMDLFLIKISKEIMLEDECCRLPNIGVKTLT